MPTINTIPTFGDNSEDVKKLQETLNTKEVANLVADGIFGNLTKKAVMRFQDRNGLVVDGIVGNNTMRTLGIELSKCIDTDGTVRLSWDRISPPKEDWTKITMDCIKGLYNSSFSKCMDIKDFRSDYYSLDDNQKIVVWSELISAMAKFESNWRPTSWMVESTMDLDTVTKKQIRSEGLLQLSYQDKRNYSARCEFDWEHDKNLPDDDSNKTIFDPRKNLEFGIRILAHQIDRAGKNSIVFGCLLGGLKIRWEIY